MFFLFFYIKCLFWYSITHNLALLLFLAYFLVWDSITWGFQFGPDGKFLLIETGLQPTGKGEIKVPLRWYKSVGPYKGMSINETKSFAKNSEK